MQITLTGRHTDLDGSIKDYVSGKLSKLQKYTNKIEKIKVILDIQGFRHIAEIIVVMREKNLAVKEEGEGFPEAFDIALGVMQKRLRRFWKKRKHHEKK